MDCMTGGWFNYVHYSIYRYTDGVWLATSYRFKEGLDREGINYLQLAVL